MILLEKSEIVQYLLNYCETRLERKEHLRRLILAGHESVCCFILYDPMKILLVSDTHGKLNEVNRLAAKTEADACFHLGDIGLFTKESLKKLSADALLKRLKHIPEIPPEVLSSLDGQTDPKTLRKLAEQYRANGDFEDFYSGKKKLSIPVYAIPGNREDPEVCSALQKHGKHIENLVFLDEGTQIGMEGFLVCGLGGEIGETGRHAADGPYRTTIRQIDKLRDNVLKRGASAKKRILLTHVPPYTNERLGRLVRELKPVLSVCGHLHHFDERTLDKTRCSILTLPSIERGYAVLELKQQTWSYQIRMERRELVRAVTNAFENNMDLYRSIEDMLKRILPDFFSSASIQVRIKSRGSLAGKVLRKYSGSGDAKEILSSLADLIGARMILLRKDQLDQADAILRDPEAFELDERMTEDTMARLAEREFGYLSRHYTILVTPRWLDRIGEKTDDKGRKKAIAEVKKRMRQNKTDAVPVEIQVRTWLQHVWAELEHDSAYKSNRDIPRDLQRGWSALAAILEKTDDDIVRHLNRLEQHNRSNAYFIAGEVKRRIDDLEIIAEEQLRETRQGTPCWKNDMENVRNELLRLYLLNGSKEKDLANRDVLNKLNAVLGPPSSIAGTKDQGILKAELKKDPMNPKLMIRLLLEENKSSGTESGLPFPEKSEMILPTFLRSAIAHCDGLIRSSSDLPWAFAGKAFFMLLLKCFDPDEGNRTDDADAIYDCVLRLIDLCNERSVANLPGESIVATPEAKDALGDLEKIVALSPVKDLKTTNGGNSAPILTCITDLLALGRYAHLTEHKKAMDKTAAAPVILAGGCDTLMRGKNGERDSEELKDLRKLFRKALEDGSRPIAFYTGKGTGICSIDLMEGKGNKVFRFGIKNIAGTTENSDYTEYSVYEAILEWKAMMADGYRFDDVALIGFGLGRISDLECRIALALGARVTVIRHRNFKKNRLVFEGVPYWSDHPSLVRLPLIREASPRNRSFSDRKKLREIKTWRDAGFPEPVMLRVFMLFKPYHEENYKRSTPEYKLTRLVHRIKQLKTSADYLDLDEIDRGKSLSQQHRLLSFETLLEDSGEPLPTVKLPQGKPEKSSSPRELKKWLNGIELNVASHYYKYGEREHARWYIERWLQGTRYGDNKIDRNVPASRKRNPCMTAWHDLDDDTIEKDTGFLKPYAIAREVMKTKYIRDEIARFFPRREQEDTRKK